MRTRNCSTLLIAAIVLIGTAVTVEAADITLWNWLGIPQGVQKIRDATVNRRGNLPGMERKDALKRLADPENLESDNPAIKKAAEIKKEEDLKKQKIKAIKYLADVGCCCYPGVKEALLAALDDCTEDVRYEAAVAFCEAAGNHCDPCEKCSCCGADVMQKLHELAYEQDETCCYVEPSEQVRAAARNALESCRRMFPPSPAGVEPVPDPNGGGKKEVPIEAPQPIPEPPLELPGETPVTETSAYEPVQVENRLVNPAVEFFPVEQFSQPVSPVVVEQGLVDPFADQVPSEPPLE